MKIVLTYSELRALLVPVLPHAGTDDMLPVLCQIPIAESDGYLYAQATNRFIAAFKRVKPATPPEVGASLSIERADASRLLTLLKPSRGQNPEITIEATPSGELVVSTAAGGFSLGFTGLNITFAAPSLFDDDGGAKYPDLTGLLPASMDDSAAYGGFDLSLLSKFTPAISIEYTGGKGAAAMRFGATPAKPMLLTVGTDFVGLVMPRRVVAGDAVSTADPVPALVAEFKSKAPQYKAKKTAAAS